MTENDCQKITRLALAADQRPKTAAPVRNAAASAGECRNDTTWPIVERFG
jgi:hypothetical protein